MSQEDQPQPQPQPKKKKRRKNARHGELIISADAIPGRVLCLGGCDQYFESWDKRSNRICPNCEKNRTQAHTPRRVCRAHAPLPSE